MNVKLLSQAKTTRRKAFSLVELAIAIGIAAFVMTAILGVIPLTLDLAGQANQRAQAGSMGRDLLSTYRLQPDYQSTLSQFPLPDITALDLSAPLTGEIYINPAGLTTSDAAQALFRADYRIVADADDPQLVYVSLTLAWPAQATNPPYRYRLTTALELEW